MRKGCRCGPTSATLADASDDIASTGGTLSLYFSGDLIAPRAELVEMSYGFVLREQYKGRWRPEHFPSGDEALLQAMQLLDVEGSVADSQARARGATPIEKKANVLRHEKSSLTPLATCINHTAHNLNYSNRIGWIVRGKITRWQSNWQRSKRFRSVSIMNRRMKCEYLLHQAAQAAYGKDRLRIAKPVVTTQAAPEFGVPPPPETEDEQSGTYTVVPGVGRVPRGPPPDPTSGSLYTTIKTSDGKVEAFREYRPPEAQEGEIPVESTIIPSFSTLASMEGSEASKNIVEFYNKRYKHSEGGQGDMWGHRDGYFDLCGYLRSLLRSLAPLISTYTTLCAAERGQLTL
eukprot:1325995-Amorphochlora_amoeboformis.AAC.1